MVANQKSPLLDQVREALRGQLEADEVAEFLNHLASYEAVAAAMQN